MDSNLKRPFEQPIERRLEENPQVEMESVKSSPPLSTETTIPAKVVSTSAVVTPEFKPVPPVEAVRDPLLTPIERALSDGLVDLYTELPENLRQTFKIFGEQIAQTIVEQMRIDSLDEKDVFDLITDWLKIIPRLDGHYLLQAAKIKTDEIIDLFDQYKAGGLS